MPGELTQSHPDSAFSTQSYEVYDQHQRTRHLTTERLISTEESEQGALRRRYFPGGIPDPTVPAMHPTFRRVLDATEHQNLPLRVTKPMLQTETFSATVEFIYVAGEWTMTPLPELGIYTPTPPRDAEQQQPDTTNNTTFIDTQRRLEGEFVLEHTLGDCSGTLLQSGVHSNTWSPHPLRGYHTQPTRSPDGIQPALRPRHLPDARSTDERPPRPTHIAHLPMPFTDLRRIHPEHEPALPEPAPEPAAHRPGHEHPAATTGVSDAAPTQERQWQQHNTHGSSQPQHNRTLPPTTTKHTISATNPR